MPKFEPNQRHSTEMPQIEVETGDAALSPGTHTFELVVEDNDGNVSDPDVIRVVIVDDRKPTAVLEAPSLIPFGESFNLDGRRSRDPAPGRIARFHWRRLD